MKAVIQRVNQATVLVEKQRIASIEAGLLVLLGVAGSDIEEDGVWLADKCVHLRIFEDATGKMNRSLLDTGGSMLVVSQFTLLGDCRKGRRPSWQQAAPPELALPLYHSFVERVRLHGITVATGQFQASMAVHLVNHGPVTLLLDSQDR